MKAQQFVYFHSSKDHEWETPSWLFDALNVEFGFTLDVCASEINKKHNNFFSVDIDGLNQDWGENVCFMNPPYGREIIKWMKKAYFESKKGATVVCLVPVRPDAKWWHDFALKGEVRFFRQRLKFRLGGKRSDVAPFASAIIVFRPYQYSVKQCEIVPVFT